MHVLPYIRELIFKRYEMHNNLQDLLTRTVICCLIFTAYIGAAIGQTDFTAEADKEFKRGGYYTAAQEYIKAYAKIKAIDDKGRTAFMAGESFRLLQDPAAAEEWYTKAIGLRFGESNPEVFVRYGDIMATQQEFDEAIEWYITFKENGGDASLADSKIRESDDDALALDEPPSRYVVENLLLLNSDSYDYGAGFASNKSDQVIFASSRESSEGSGEDPITGQSFMDLFRAEQDKKGRWSTPEPLNSTINTASNEGTVTFDSRFKTMYFTRCVSDDQSSFACDIYRSSILGDKMGPSEVVELIDRASNDTSQIAHPSFTVGDGYLMFVSDMAGGQGGKDIWYVAYNEREDSFGTPQNMGPQINTSGDEMFPTMRFDGALFYASSGNGAMGGLDIIRALPGDGEMEFKTPEALPYPVNSSSDDFGLIFYADEDRGIFTSSRPGGKGKDDLYSFRLPDMEYCYRANVYDFDTGMPLSAAIIIQGTDGESWSLTADGDGSISLCEKEIKGTTTYDVDVQFEGYIGTGDRFSTVGLTESTTFAREYFLKEVVLDEEYAMPLVLYPFNEAALLINNEVNSADSLNYLLDIMQRNETFVIQLESHTDSRGKNNYNKKLSQDRAQTCVDYLISRGISLDRLVPVGHGEEMMLVSDADIAKMEGEEAKERGHQMNRRTVFRILRFDYDSDK